MMNGEWRTVCDVFCVPDVCSLSAIHDNILRNTTHSIYNFAITPRPMTLPAHVVETIALYALADNPNVAVILGGVCRSWRESVHACPALWTRLVIGPRATKAKIELWRQRSKKHILSVRVSQTFEASRHESLLRSMADVMPLIRQLEFINEAAFSKLGWTNSLSHLQTLIISSPRFNGTRKVRLEFLGEQQHLRHVTFRNVPLSLSHRNPGAEWSATSAKLINVSFSWRLLRQMSNLESLDVENSAFPWHHTYDPPIALPLLKRFRHSCGSHNAHRAQRSLAMPSLEVLDLYALQFHAHRVLDSLVYTFHQLTFLDVGRSDIEDRGLVPLLTEFDQLRFLGLARTGVGKRTFHTLARRNAVNGEPETCPNLVAISLACTSIDGFQLADLIFSRSPRRQRRTAIPSQVLSMSYVYNSGTLDDAEESPSVHYSRPRIQWLCIDACRDLDFEIVPLLRQNVAVVLADPYRYYEDRARGRGRYQWDKPPRGVMADTNGVGGSGRLVDGRLIRDSRHSVLKRMGPVRTLPGWITNGIMAI